MKRWLLSFPCLLCLLLLTSCATSLVPLDAITGADTTDVLVPSPIDTVVREEDRFYELSIRFRQEPYLASEARIISRTQSQSYESALLEALFAGPSAGSMELTSLFPTGTRLISTVSQSRTLFVTLSSEFLSGYADEPVDWQEYDLWRHEAPLRRRLCLQSIVATVTENCDVDSVQILIEQKDSVTGSLRLPQNYLLDDSEDDVLMGPVFRDDSVLLGIDHTLSYILTLLGERNWDRLYYLLCLRDSRTGIERPTLEDYLVRMQALPALTAFATYPPTLSLDGTEATVQVHVTLTLQDLTRVNLGSRVLRLSRESGLWKISLEQLEGLMEVAQ